VAVRDQRLSVVPPAIAVEVERHGHAHEGRVLPARVVPPLLLEEQVAGVVLLGLIEQVGAAVLDGEVLLVRSWNDLGAAAAEIDDLVRLLAEVDGSLLAVAESDGVVLAIGVVLGVEELLDPEGVRADIGRRVPQFLGVDALGARVARGGAGRERRLGVVVERVAVGEAEILEEVQVARAVEGAAVGGEPPVDVVLAVLELQLAGYALHALQGRGVVQDLRVPGVLGEERLELFSLAEAAQVEALHVSKEVGRIDRSAQRCNGVEAIGVVQREHRGPDGTHRYAGDRPVGRAHSRRREVRAWRRFGFRGRTTSGGVDGNDGDEGSAHGSHGLPGVKRSILEKPWAGGQTLEAGGLRTPGRLPIVLSRAARVAQAGGT
jgi:hypothetical protein